MFNRKMVFNALVGTLLLASLTGCGASPAAPDPIDEGGYTDPGAGGGYGTTPGTTPGGAGGYGTTPGTGTGGYGGTTGGTGSYSSGGELTASVEKKKNGFFLGMGKFTCTIMVTNPSSSPKTGTLTVTFTNGKKDAKTAPVTKQVSLGPNESQTYDFTDTKWTTDNVRAEVTTDASSAAPPAGGGYGTTPAYGAPAAGAYGTTPAAGAYGTPTGY